MPEPGWRGIAVLRFTSEGTGVQGKTSLALLSLSSRENALGSPGAQQAPLGSDEESSVPVDGSVVGGPAPYKLASPYFAMFTASRVAEMGGPGRLECKPGLRKP